jgi:hypothetical protein
MRISGAHPALLLLAVLYLAAALLLSVRLNPISAQEWAATPSAQFRTTSVELQPANPWPSAVSDQPQPWYDAPIPTFDVEGAVWEHPSFQLQFGLTLLITYDNTSDPRYLAAAERVGEHLLGYAARSRGGLFFPYAFEWYGSQPPWYSALSQGKGLGFFSRLWEHTGQDRWRRVADDILRTFSVPPSRTDPWVAFVDERGYLWLEEYPGGGVPAQVLNGHITAVFGLYEYWRVFGSPLAERLLRGGLATVIERGHEFRVPGGYSYYGLRDAAQWPLYHDAHVRMLAVLAEMTGSPELARLTTDMESDGAVAPYRGNIAVWLATMGVLLLALAVVLKPYERLSPPAVSSSATTRPEAKGI